MDFSLTEEQQIAVDSFGHIELVANCDQFKSMKHSSTCPHAFTEQGVAMLSAVLHSKTAVEVSIQIMQAFVEMRKFISTHEGLFQRLEKVEKKQIETDQKFESIFSALENKKSYPQPRYLLRWRNL